MPKVENIKTLFDTLSAEEKEMAAIFITPKLVLDVHKEYGFDDALTSDEVSWVLDNLQDYFRENIHEDIAHSIETAINNRPENPVIEIDIEDITRVAKEEGIEMSFDDRNRLLSSISNSLDLHEHVRKFIVDKIHDAKEKK
jgi:hypothetical protein